MPILKRPADQMNDVALKTGAAGIDRRWSDDFTRRWTASVCEHMGWSFEGEIASPPSLLPFKRRQLHAPILNVSNLTQQAAQTLFSNNSDIKFAFLGDPSLPIEPDEPVVMRIGLLHRTADDIRGEDMSRKCRQCVNRAERSALLVDETASPQTAVEAARLINQSRHILGSPAIPERLIDGLMRDDLLKILHVRDPESSESRGVLTYVRDDGICWLVWGANNPKFRETRFSPFHLLAWHALQRACEKGDAVFDFGRSPFGSSGYNFKRWWGAKPFPVITEPGSALSSRYQTQSRLTNIWTRMPMPVTNLLSGYLYSRLVR